MEAIKQQTERPRLVDVQGFMKYCGIGRNKAMEFGKNIGARVEICGCVRYDLAKADDYFDRLTGSGSDTGDKEKAKY